MKKLLSVLFVTNCIVGAALATSHQPKNRVSKVNTISCLRTIEKKQRSVLVNEDVVNNILVAAAYHDQWHVVKTLLESDDMLDSYVITEALAVAIQYQHINTMRILLPYVSDEEYLYKLFDELAFNQQWSLVEILLPYIAVDNALVVLATWGWQEKVIELLKHPLVSANGVNEALVEAAQSDCCDIVQLLLDDGRVTQESIDEALNSLDDFGGDQLDSFGLLQEYTVENRIPCVDIACRT